MLRHLLAPIVPLAADSLHLDRTLPGEPSGGTVALTFDDGPHPEGTPAMLEILAAAGARASFFVVGEQVRARPELARRILAEGHALALHGDRHRLQLRLGDAEVRDDLGRGREAIEDATGTTPLYHRPPFGIYSAAGLRIVRERGLRPLLWSAWGRDWRAHTTPEQIARRATRGLGPGTVILLHDADFYSKARSHQRTAEALPRILSLLQARKLDTVSLV